MKANDIKEALDQVIQQVIFYKLRVSFRAIEPIYLSEYKGSAFRGCLGDAFRHMVCRYPGKKCAECRLQGECSFSCLFESPLPAAHHLHGKYTHPPRPYIIDPMPGRETLLEAGSEFYFDLVLIGSAIDLLPTLLRVFQVMGELGLGSRNSKFEPIRVDYYTPSGGYQALPVFGLPAGILLADLPVQAITTHANLVFEHPIRFLVGAKPFKSLPSFGMLVDNLARRMTLLAHLYCGAAWVDTNQAFELESKVKIAAHELEWKDWTRYSGTKEMNLHFDGQLGEISYEGEVRPWTSLLNLGSWLHAGSTATFGLGKYKIVP